MKPMADALTAVARVRAVPGSEETVRDALIAMVAPTREEEGCLDYRLHEVDSDPGLFCFVARWRSEADLDAHLDEPHIADGLAAIADDTEYVVVSRMTQIA
ncbi:MAG: antibiotic biosynthesis monooxygenase [Acidimicrobiia bacterium]|nr:antibiotic biosynthesis monooxygenase [Acidimicrobiia bacterium]MYC85940.1 antibiotic biosynthesis monooxygenase [Acidimicrobiia bacterium]